MEESRGAVVGIFLTTRKSLNNPKEIRLIEKIVLKKTASELKHSNNAWKTDVMRMVQGMGYEVISSPSFLKSKNNGCDLVMTVLEAENGFIGKRSKPVTRGGKEIGKPVIGKKTMASLRRKK